MKVKLPVGSCIGTNLKPYSLATNGWSAWMRIFFVLMKITVNGEEKEVANGLSITGLLESLQIRPGRVVVERNRDIVPRDSFTVAMLAEGDALEIVHFVGGG